MRAAYLRALNYDRTDFTDVCNDCRTDYILDSGQFVHVRTTLKDTENKTYRLWYCNTCSAKFVEQEQNDNFSLI